MPEPQVTESIGGTTTVNSDTRVRMWVVQIPEEGTYDIATDGNVNGYISPRLAFGHDSSYGWLLWVFGGLFVIGLVELVAASIWSAPSGQDGAAPRAARAADHRRPDVEQRHRRSAASYTPTDQGVRSSSSGTWRRCGIPAR